MFYGSLMQEDQDSGQLGLKAKSPRGGGGSESPLAVLSSLSPGSPWTPHLSPSTPQIFVFLVVVSLLLTLGFAFMVKEFKGKHHYVFALHARTEAVESFFIFWGFLILLSVMVPMAMFIL